MSDAAILFTLGLMLAVSGCGISLNGGGNGTPEDVGVNLSVAFVSRAQGAPKCTATITWSFTPKSLSGDKGSSAAVNKTESYEVFASQGTCTFQTGALNLRKGTWNVAGSIVGSCDVQLKNSFTTVTFTQGEAGCR